ncbi:MAG: DNA polymerase III subunit epsilon [Gammaproteobacteria bacterium]|nr:DNA polymerase III subunit epsilon [Gammaproteobacteria bacterium]
MRQVILDTETTGLSTDLGHRIIEIGCVELVNRKLTGRHYHQYINPQRDIDDGAMAVHGITNDFLQNKPYFADISKEFMDFIVDAELIIHNAPFDVGFINYELKLLKQSWKPIADYCRIVDTLTMARQLHVGQRNSLDALCKRYTIDSSQRELHGALLDANLLARVYLAMTGGQATLFAEAEANEVSAQQQTETVVASHIKRVNLCVTKADEAELVDHDKMLQVMAQKGKCLWLETVE